MIIRIALGLLALLLPLGTRAASITDTQYFDAPLTDKSMAYLGQLFGTVGNVIHGNNFLLATVFAKLNTAMWIFAAVIASYYMVKSVIKTGMEGKVLGEQGNYWLAARTISGVLILLPKFNGYSFIQVIVMWVVVQGIGLADQTWNAALDYFNTGGTFYSVDLPGNGSSADVDAENKLFTEVLSDSASMLNAAVCMYSLQQQAFNLSKTKNLPAPHFPDPFSEPNSIRWGSSDYPSACGFYALNNATPDSAKVIKTAAMLQTAISIMSLAEYIVNSQRVTDKQTVTVCTNCLEANILGSIAREYVNTIKQAWPAIPTDSAFGKTIQQARAEGWIMAGSYYNDLININAAPSNNGWVGHPYRFELDPKYQGIIFNNVDTANTIPNWQSLTSPLKDNNSIELLSVSNAVKQYFVNVRAYYTQAQNNKTINNNAINPGVNTDVSNQIASMEAQIFPQKIDTSPSFDVKGMTVSPFFFLPKSWTRPVTAFDVIDQDIKHLIIGSMEVWSKAVLPRGASGQDSYLDPITRSRHLGQGLISVALTFWQNVTQHTFNFLVGSAATMTGLMAASAAALSFLGIPGQQSIPGRNITVVLNTGMQMGFQIMTSHVFWYLPLGAAISTPLFIIGASLGVYVPLIPFIVFTFAVMGWFISVLEAMVAAPLVAFGMTHPEGHDVLGKTEQGIMLLFALFIRPACMVIGLLVGIILVFLGTELFDAGYLDLFLSLLRDSQHVLSKLAGVDGAFTILIIAMIFLVIYTFILVAIVNQCMTAVYVIPDKIMRWIGVPPESSGIGAMMEQTKAGAESKMGEGAQAGSGMGGDMRHSGIQPQTAQHQAKKQGGADMKSGG